MSDYTLYLKVRNVWDLDNELEKYFYYMVPVIDDATNIPILSRALSMSEHVWKEDNSGIRIIKDKFGSVIRSMESEDEHKEFMWVKLRSNKL